ncbi:hypothetical protein ABB37_00417 [Leptomonas pyrrhocoris]|uniref:Uncharacterized protein n=1 Tax=Leptomonas pyrrhocoris TaxID=157538 RepID=A0A0N0E092_LEPPY|nr:hypothetical protein ABB37_00417 [Leptomonas pyrrhocoris]KPA86168.1 hypothetical protein ABB37_00417 [Leptomonas pyrrhocoris]|eukprot:XP_015664607.1 hypothetical protein ABB37_00417 [Leptomonas pyrrhocoris]
MAGRCDPHDAANWGDDSPNNSILSGDEEDEFNEEDCEENDEGEEEEDDGSTSYESGGGSVQQSQRTDPGDGSRNGSVQEAEREEENDDGFDAEEERGDYDEEEETEGGDSESAGSVSGEEDEPQTDANNFNANLAAAFSFGSAAASSAFSQPPALTSTAKVFGNVDRAPPPVPFANTSAVPSAFAQTSLWPSATTHGSSSSVPAQSTTPSSFAAAAPTPSAASPSPVLIDSGCAESHAAPAKNVEGRNPVHHRREQTTSPTPAHASVPSQGKSAAAMSLQFVDFKRSFGQNLRRTRSAAEEASEVKASLARYELVVPTDKFDAQIEKALYSC